jgi:hypothetical protein
LLAVKVVCERFLVGDVEALNSLAATCTQLRSLAREPSLYRRLYLSDLRPSALRPDSLRPMLSDAYLRLAVGWADGRLELLDITNCVQLSESAVMEVLELQPKLTALLAARHCTAPRRFFAGALMIVLSSRRRHGWPALRSLDLGALTTSCVAGDDFPRRRHMLLPSREAMIMSRVAASVLSTLQSYCKELNVDSVCMNCMCLMASSKESWCMAAAEDDDGGAAAAVDAVVVGGTALPDHRLLTYCVEKVWCERCMIEVAGDYQLPPLIAFRCSSCADKLLPGMRPPDYCVGCMATNAGDCCSTCSRIIVPGCVSCLAVQNGGGMLNEADLPKQCSRCGAKFCKHCAIGSCLWCGEPSYTLLV